MSGREEYEHPDFSLRQWYGSVFVNMVQMKRGQPPNQILELREEDKQTWCLADPRELQCSTTQQQGLKGLLWSQLEDTAYPPAFFAAGYLS